MENYAAVSLLANRSATAGCHIRIQIFMERLKPEAAVGATVDGQTLNTTQLMMALGARIYHQQAHSFQATMNQPGK